MRFTYLRKEKAIIAKLSTSSELDSPSISS